MSCKAWKARLPLLHRVRTTFCLRLFRWKAGTMHFLRGWNQKRSVCKFMFDLFFAICCLLFCRKTFPFVAVFTLLVLVSIADTIGAAAFRNICHTLSPFSSCPEPRIEAVFRDADASADPKNTKFGSAVAQIVGRAQADGQHLCNFLHCVHQCCGFQAVSRRLV